MLARTNEVSVPESAHSPLAQAATSSVNPEPTIELRAVASADLDAFFQHMADPAANHMAAFVSEAPRGREEFDARLARLLADRSIEACTILWAGEVAGHVAEFERDGEREITYWLGRAFWGRGIATAALRAFLARRRERAPQRPLLARAAADNAASIRVLEKCGFQPLERTRAFAQARGAEVDEVVLHLAGGDEGHREA